jgi:hypothetical protein
MFSFNEGDLLTLLGQTDSKKWTGLTGADYNRVKFFCHAVLSFSGDVVSIAMRCLRSEAFSP